MTFLLISKTCRQQIQAYEAARSLKISGNCCRQLVVQNSYQETFGSYLCKRFHFLRPNRRIKKIDDNFLRWIKDACKGWKYPYY